MSSEPIRLQKYLSQYGYCSRRAAEELIRDKKIKINGSLATLGDRVSDTDQIIINGKVFEHTSTELVYFVFHKPEGVETTLKQGRTPTLADYDFEGKRVFPVGRLDKDSRGLLIMTNDGEAAHRLMHPSFRHDKEYIVTVHQPISDVDLYRMEQGIDIEGKITAPCETKRFDHHDKIFHITLREGRKRQIRRMCESLGYRVLDLLRIRTAHMHLGELPPGKYRHLSPTEIKQLQKLLNLTPKKK